MEGIGICHWDGVKGEEVVGEGKSPTFRKLKVGTQLD